MNDTTSPNGPEKDSEHPSSVPTATEAPYHLDPEALLNDAVGSVGVKCTNCKVVTPHDWIKITPSGDLAPEDMLRTTKRLKLCTVCGNMSLTN